MGDFGFSPISFGGIDSYLAGLVQSIIQVLTYIWDALVAVAQFLYDLLVTIAEALFITMENLWRALVHVFGPLYNTILKPIIDEVVKIEQWLAKYINPVVRVLQRIRDWYLKYIYPWQRLAIQIITALRVAISLFRLLGFQWAQKLDNILVKAEGYVTDSILAVVQTLNTVTSWLQLMSDPTQIIRKAFWQSTAFSGLSEILKVTHLGSLRPVTAAETAQAKGYIGLNDPSVANVTRNADGSTTFSPAMQDLIDGAARAVKQVNPAVPGYQRPSP